MFKKAILFSLVGVGFCLSGCQTKVPPKTMPAASPWRYVGTWYNVASYRSQINKACSCSRSVYTLQPKGEMQLNTYCFQHRKNRWFELGRYDLKPVDTSFSKFKVSQLRIDHHRKYSKYINNYWILYVSPKYRTAIVGTPDHRYLSFLTRQPHISKVTYNKLAKIAEAQGYNVAKLRMVNHVCK